jgi:FkbM family methyltransferase
VAYWRGQHGGGDQRHGHHVLHGRHPVSVSFVVLSSLCDYPHMTSALLLRDLVRCSRPSSILDIGANPIDGPPVYREMLGYGLCTVTGFEPQHDALAKLEQRKGPLERYLPRVVGYGREHRLKITKAAGMTSLLTPDENQLRLFNAFPDWGSVVEEVDVQTHRLDDLDIDEFDMLKIDVQGAELMVFQTAGNVCATLSRYTLMCRSCRCMWVSRRSVKWTSSCGRRGSCRTRCRPY